MPDAQRLPDAQLLTGRVAEWGELLGILDERAGLTVIVADPWSGTSSLLAAATAEDRETRILLDARTCGNALDLAMGIADEAVATLAPEALSWWLGKAPPSSTEGLRLWRSIQGDGLDVSRLREGEPPATDRLRDALALCVKLLPAQGGTLVVDHLGPLLAAMRARPAGEILDVFRASRQHQRQLDLVLIDHPDGRIDAALGDAHHPLYRAGGRLILRRPTPDRIVEDLSLTRPLTEVPVPMLRVAAEMAAGVPELTWRIVDLAMREDADADPATAGLAGWRALCAANEPSSRHAWDRLRTVHPYAQHVVAAISLGLKPHALPAAGKTINDALHSLRDVGLAWQPAERSWVIADPLLVGWARERPPPWARRRSAGPAIRARRFEATDASQAAAGGRKRAL